MGSRAEYLQRRASGFASTKPPEPATEKPARKKKDKRRRTRAEDGRFQNGVYGMQTKLSVSETREQLEKLLQKHGCDRFGYVTDTTTKLTTVQFRCQSRTIRFVLSLPQPETFSTRIVHGQVRNLPKAIIERRHEQALRARWRAIYCGIKAKIVLVEAGIESMEEAFLAAVVNESTGLTIADHLRRGDLLPQLTAGAVREVEAELLPPARANGAAHAEAMA
jgi:hypothetical protein